MRPIAWIKNLKAVSSGTISRTAVLYSLVFNTVFIAELLLILVSLFPLYPFSPTFFFLITMSNSFPLTGHNTITQLNDLRNSYYLFGMIPLIRQQHQEKKDIRNNCFRFPENKKKIKVSSLNCTTLFSKN